MSEGRARIPGSQTFMSEAETFMAGAADVNVSCGAVWMVAPGSRHRGKAIREVLSLANGRVVPCKSIERGHHSLGIPLFHELVSEGDAIQDALRLLVSFGMCSLRRCSKQ